MIEMPRRFLTAEDVRRAGGGEIVVDESTVVTPHALEAARAAGVTIRTASGAWREPAPDRGPDAGGAEAGVHRPPHLPEPPADTQSPTVIVTAVGRNRPGVLAQITTAIAELGGNVHDVTQRIVADYFHIVLVVELAGSGNFPDLKTRLECMGGPEDFAVNVMHERAFRFMHRV
jgi:ACT domain-containing protein